MKIPRQVDVVVAGAGPVGMIAALTLHDSGVQVVLVDPASRPASRSYAAGLHPSTLELLDRFGMAAAVWREAVRVDHLRITDGEVEQAVIDYSLLPGRFPQICLLRQSVLEEKLMTALKARGVPILWRHRVSEVVDQGEHVEVTIDELEQRMHGYAVAHLEWGVETTSKVKADFVLGADGINSMVRGQLDAEFPELHPAEHFAVFEFSSDDDLPQTPELAITHGNRNLFWPLDAHEARWAFQHENLAVGHFSREKNRDVVMRDASANLNLGMFSDLLGMRAPAFKAMPAKLFWRAAVRFERRLASPMGRGRVWLAGDAAHLASPLAMQSINRGLAEAVDYAQLMAAIIREREALHRLEERAEAHLANWRWLAAAPREARAEGSSSWLGQNASAIVDALPGNNQDIHALAGQIKLQVPAPPKSELSFVLGR